MRFVQLSLDSKYNAFESFNCINPKAYTTSQWALGHLDCLSRYVSLQKGALNDLKYRNAVTTVVYCNDKHAAEGKQIAGYFTLMAGHIHEKYVPVTDHDRFIFINRTYPAVKILRFAVNRKYHNKTLMDDEFGPMKISQYMLSEICTIAKNLSFIDEECAYDDSGCDGQDGHIGVRFVITDALALKNTLAFYEDNGFFTFKKREYEQLKHDIIYEGRVPQEFNEMGIPMYFDLNAKVVKPYLMETVELKPDKPKSIELKSNAINKLFELLKKMQN